MSDFFASPRLTILRAQHHILDLTLKINEFINNKPWSYSVDKDRDGVHDLHKFKFARRLPNDLPNIVFDAANNLRSVLDQVGYASAIASGKVDPRRTQFPFGNDAAGVESVVGRRCRDLPPEIVALFRGFKPYKGGNDILWALNKLCNTKKHCTLVPMQLGSGFLALGEPGTCTSRPLEGGGGQITIEQNVSIFFAPIAGRNLGWNPEKYEIVMARTPPGKYANYNSNVTFAVSIDGIETLADKPAIAVLNQMVGIVDRVCEATEAECRRIGLIK